MLDKLNLACNVKLTEQDEKYLAVQHYIFFRSLSDAVRRNHRALTLDLNELQDLKPSTDTRSIFAKRTQVQNSLLNLLNAHKLFLDILQRNHGKREGRFYRRFKVVLSHYYDENFDYRIFEVLRNYCQHFSALPIDIFSDFEGVSYVFINKQELSKDDQLRRKVEKELESPLYMELNSIVRDWIDVVADIYGLVLDYFAYRAAPVANDYLRQLSTDVMAQRADPVVAEIMRSVDIKIVKGRMLFPVLPDSKPICLEIIERIGSAGQLQRYAEVKSIFNEIRSSKNSSRKLKKIGMDIELPKLDTLTLKQLNSFLSRTDPF